MLDVVTKIKDTGGWLNDTFHYKTEEKFIVEVLYNGVWKFAGVCTNKEYTARQLAYVWAENNGKIDDFRTIKIEIVY